MSSGKRVEINLKRFLCTISMVTFLCFASPNPASAAHGPLKATSRLPINRVFLNPVLETPEILDCGLARESISLDYGSVYVNERSSNWDVLMDMEFAVLTFCFKMGLPWHTEGAISLPVLYYYDGFMDSFLEWYHDSLGVPNYGRENRPHNEYGYRVKKNGKDWFRPTTGGEAGVGDGKISIKKGLLDHDDTRLAIKGTVKVPSGDPERGLGSGELDAGIMLLFGHDYDKWRLYLGVAYNWLGAPDVRGDFDPEISDTAGGAFAIEYIWSEKLSLLGQTEWVTSPFSGTGIDALDKDFLGLTLGARYTSRDAIGIELALSEDLSDAAADFAIHVGMTIDF